MTLIGGIDAGGTSMKLATAIPDGEIIASHRVPTGEPGATLAQVRNWFASQPPIDGLGVAAFGPIRVDRRAPDYGHLLVTSKPGWSHFDLGDALRPITPGPIAIELDVTGAAIAEHQVGAGQGIANFAYVTVGTGVGMGLLAEGTPFPSALHPEAGHIFARRHPADADFAGTCPHHGDCIEGMMSAAAIRARWGVGAEAFDDDHAAWPVLGHYAGALAHAAILVAGVDRVAFGGGIGSRPILARWAIEAFEALVGPYRSVIDARGTAADMIVPASLGDRSGLIGALILAERALHAL
ncbi:ROK family protein [Sphingomonas sp. GlSt437]|uniref:ROK family protein n=1 Tax=Sphingomonas sp. GlSt437 TaxID=3389970 RepID=UPI003A8AE65A